MLFHLTKILYTIMLMALVVKPVFVRAETITIPFFSTTGNCSFC